MLLVAQLTDTHLFADASQTMFDCLTNQTFAAVVQQLAQLQPRPDLLLLTGDISQDETAASYQYARSLIGPLGIPTYWLPGNHDQDAAAMADLNGDGILPDKAFVYGGWQFILLDSTMAGAPAGYLSAEQLAWLEAQLQANHLPAVRPTFVAVHHHPIACGVDYMDQIGLTNAADFLGVIDRYASVKIVTCGHIHQAFAADRRDVAYFGTPATCMQLKPNQAAIELDDRPPGWRLFRLYPDGRFETVVQRVAYG